MQSYWWFWILQIINIVVVLHCFLYLYAITLCFLIDLISNMIFCHSYMSLHPILLKKLQSTGKTSNYIFISNSINFDSEKAQIIFDNFYDQIKSQSWSLSLSLWNDYYNVNGRRTLNFHIQSLHLRHLVLNAPHHWPATESWRDELQSDHYWGCTRFRAVIEEQTDTTYLSQLLT